jgi:hypothetical protein
MQSKTIPGVGGCIRFEVGTFEHRSAVREDVVDRKCDCCYSRGVGVDVQSALGDLHFFVVLWRCGRANRKGISTLFFQFQMDCYWSLIWQKFRAFRHFLNVLLLWIPRSHATNGFRLPWKRSQSIKREYAQSIEGAGPLNCPGNSLSNEEFRTAKINEVK